MKTAFIAALLLLFAVPAAQAEPLVSMHARLGHPHHHYRHHRHWHHHHWHHHRHYR